MKILVCKQFTFDAAHRLVHHEGKCRNVHGHTYKIEVAVSGDVPRETGMVIDFADLKAKVNAEIGAMDHAYIYNSQDEDPGMISRMIHEGYQVWPMDGEPTAENMAKDLFLKLQQRNLAVEFVRVWETPTSYAEARKET